MPAKIDPKSEAWRAQMRECIVDLAALLKAPDRRSGDLAAVLVDWVHSAYPATPRTTWETYVGVILHGRPMPLVPADRLKQIAAMLAGFHLRRWPAYPPTRISDADPGDDLRDALKAAIMLHAAPLPEPWVSTAKLMEVALDVLLNRPLPPGIR